MEENWWPSKKEYDPKITKESWLKLLDDKSIFSESTLHIFACFYDYGGVATCTELANKYGGTSNTYLNSAVSLAKRIVNAGHCKKIDLGDENSKYWPVLFVSHYAEKKDAGVYVWKIRDELMEALKEYGIEKWLYVVNESYLKKLISQYKILLHENKKVALDDEKYKWELITNCKNVSLREFVKSVINSSLTFSTMTGVLKRISEEKPEKLQNILNKLYDENFELNERLKNYKNEMTDLVLSIFPNVKNYAEDERTASVFLTCNNPVKHTFYMDEYYQKLCKYLNVKSKKAGEKYEHYLDLIKQLEKYLLKDSQLVNTIENELSGLEKSSLLIAQNIVYTLLEEGNITMPATNNYDDYVKLLKSNHNIILHGAPGTGKTYLAKQIANAMGEKGDGSDIEVGFVQFHPSYDYTDFVEGLRPKNGDDGQIGFERKDGVFKEFCKRAIESIDNGNLKVDNFDEAWDKLIDKVRSAIAENNLLKIGKWEYGLSQTESLKYSSMDSPSRYTFTITKENIYAAYQHKQARPKGGFQKDMEDIVQYMKENFDLKDYVAPQFSTVNSQLSTPFIFIIDEINRGEISKIFGDLFFSIDPGYRVKIDKISELKKSDMVQTQYQNLVTENDYFDEGFFIPENVYIIGTMNDIDRSVESMDFAMRRRFVFKEITAGESAENMNLSDEARRRMTALNEEISKIDGLGSSYHIGAAYFLKDGISISTEEEFSELWELRLESLLTEYLRGTGNESKLKDLKAAYEKGESNSDDSGSDE